MNAFYRFKPNSINDRSDLPRILDRFTLTTVVCVIVQVGAFLNAPGETLS